MMRDQVSRASAKSPSDRAIDNANDNAAQSETDFLPNILLRRNRLVEKGDNQWHFADIVANAIRNDAGRPDRGGVSPPSD